MPVKLPDGDVVSIQDERAKRCLRLKIALTVTCDRCQPVAVNGMLCHENGCSNAWIDAKFECKECGSEFEPETATQEFCGADCRAMHHGEDLPDEG